MYAYGVKPDQKPRSAAFDLGLHCLNNYVLFYGNLGSNEYNILNAIILNTGHTFFPFLLLLLILLFFVVGNFHINEFLLF